MRHVLVTGAAGFIGSQCVERLLRDRWRVTAVDNFDSFYSPGVKRGNLAAAQQHDSFCLVELDIRDLEQLQRTLLDEYDAILHLAAKPGVRPSIENPALYYDVNVRGLSNVLEFARARGIPQFVFASSSSVYGMNPRVPWREDDYVLRPVSPYASSKIGGELLGQVYSTLYGIRFIGLRYFSVYGPRQRPDLLIHKFARLMLQGKPVPQYGDGSSRRDYTWVGDIVAGTVTALNYSESMYELINLGNNETVSLSEVISTLEESLDTHAILQAHPNQLGDMSQTWADISKARALLGYAPSTSFREGVRSFATWLRSGHTPTAAATSAHG